jgi:hypothetical protein
MVAFAHVSARRFIDYIKGPECCVSRARGYTWADFQDGNVAAERHGAHSPRRVQPIAAALVEELAETVTWCSPPAFRSAVASWAHAEAESLVGLFVKPPFEPLA